MCLMLFLSLCDIASYTYQIQVKLLFKKKKQTNKQKEKKNARPTGYPIWKFHVTPIQQLLLLLLLFALYGF